MTELFAIHYHQMNPASFKVFKGYTKINEIYKYLDKPSYQRETSTTRTDTYAKFLTTINLTQIPYTPDIVLGLTVTKEVFKKLSTGYGDQQQWNTISIHKDIDWHSKGVKTNNAKIGALKIKNSEFIEFKVIDGMHRIEAFNKAFEEGVKLPDIAYTLLIFSEEDKNWYPHFTFYNINSKSKPLTSRENIEAISKITKDIKDPFVTYMKKIKKQSTLITKSLTDIEFLHLAEIFYRIFLRVEEDRKAELNKQEIELDTLEEQVTANSKQDVQVLVDTTLKEFNTFTEITKVLLSQLHNKIKMCPENFQNVVEALVKVYLKEPTPHNSIEYEKEIELYQGKIKILEGNIKRISDNKYADKKTENTDDNNILNNKELPEKLSKKRDDYIHEIIELEERIELLKRLQKTDVDKNDNKTSTDENLKKRVDHFVYWINKLYDSTIDSEGILDIYNIYIRELEQWKRKIFVAMPFNEECETHWQAIETAVAKFNQNKSLSQHLQVTRIDRVKYGFSIEILKTIKDEISTAGLLIADLTDNNPNVYHELGFFLGARDILKETVNTQCILIAREKRIAPLPKTDNYTGEKSKDTHYPNPTFDVNNFAQIRFEKTKDLSDELYRKFTDIWK